MRACIRDDWVKGDFFGSSSGDFNNGNITIWKQDAADILKQVTNGVPQILVGSSLGGWIMCLVAMHFPDLVKGLIGIAAAPDFTAGMSKSLDKNAVAQLEKSDYITIDRCRQEIHTTKNLLEDGNKNLIFDQAQININCPTVLLHGMADDIVHYKV